MVRSPHGKAGQRWKRPHVVEFFDVAGAGQPGLRLEELAITEGSPLAGRSLQELRGPTVVFGEASDLNPLDRD